MYPVVFLDTETTGLDPDTSTILEIAMIRREGDGTESRFHTRIKPTKGELEKAHPKALEINGYAANSQLWESAPPMRIAAPMMANFLSGAKTLCGHNVSFDETMIKASMKRHGVRRKIPYHKIDTVTLAYEHLHRVGLQRMGLDRIRSFLGWSTDGAHTAMKDTEDCKRLFDLTWRMTPWKRWMLALRLRARNLFQVGR